MKNEELDKLFPNENVAERALSYSRISDFDKNGPISLIRPSSKSSVSLSIGSLVDDMCDDNFDVKSKYYIYNGNKPTATLGDLCDIITKNYSKLPSKSKILEIVKHNNFWSRTKDDIKLVAKFNLPEFWEYLRSIYMAGNRKIISNSDYLLAKELNDTLRIHEFSKHLFHYPDYIEVKLQYIIKYKYNGIILRGKIDFLVINHKDKTIKIIDLKTGQYKSQDFKYKLLEYRYYLQEAVYKKAEQYIKNDLGLQEYKLLPFEFLYISRNEKLPLIYEVPKKWSKAAVKGFTWGMYYYRGLDELIEEIKWHINNNVYDLQKDVYENKGRIILDSNLININE